VDRIAPEVAVTNTDRQSPLQDHLSRDRNVRFSLASGIAKLEASGIPSAALSAELLLLHILTRDRAWLYAHPEYILTSEEAARFAQLLECRASGVPTQYLTGVQEFWGLEFTVNSSVLIPRPETEHVVEVALARLHVQRIEAQGLGAHGLHAKGTGSRRMDSLNIADIGTGSGCVAIALATELPNARIVATDISSAALEVARENAVRHGADSRVTFQQMSLLESYIGKTASPRAIFDLIVSNPPYVALTDAPTLAREIREHEPHEALFAGEHGLDLYPQIIVQAGELLLPGGSLVIEIGYNSADPVCSFIVAQGGWTNVDITSDLAGIPRVIAADRA